MDDEGSRICNDNVIDIIFYGLFAESSCHRNGKKGNRKIYGVIASALSGLCSLRWDRSLGSSCDFYRTLRIF